MLKVEMISKKIELLLHIFEYSAMNQVCLMANNMNTCYLF